MKTQPSGVTASTQGPPELNRYPNPEAKRHATRAAIQASSTVKPQKIATPTAAAAAPSTPARNAEPPLPAFGNIAKSFAIDPQKYS
jgi:hypothetical protein